MRRLPYALLSVVLLLAAEVVARAVWSEDDTLLNPELNFFRDHPTLFWVQKPNLNTTIRGPVPLLTNSLGLRGPEITLPKPKDIYRILSLGGSATWGDFVHIEETYSSRLQNLLNEAPLEGAGNNQQYEVINAGVGAYSIWQSYVFLMETGMSLDPDMLMLYHQENDNMPSGVIEQHSFIRVVRYTDREAYERRRHIAPLLALLYKSRLYLGIRKLVLNRTSDLPVAQPGQLAGYTPRVPPADRKIALEGMRKLCAEKRITLVIIQPFSHHQPLGDTLLRDFSAKYKIPYVDLPSLLADQRSKLGVQALLFNDGTHPTPLGHKLIAEALATEIKKILQAAP